MDTLYAQPDATRASNASSFTTVLHVGPLRVNSLPRSCRRHGIANLAHSMLSASIPGMRLRALVRKNAGMRRRRRSSSSSSCGRFHRRGGE
jgi:hypothetical protein